MFDLSDVKIRVYEKRSMHGTIIHNCSRYIVLQSRRYRSEIQEWLKF